MSAIQICAGSKDLLKGNFAEILPFVKAHDIDQVWITLPFKEEESICEIQHLFRHSTVDICYVPNMDGLNTPKYKLKERYMKDGYLDIPLNCEAYTKIGRILERTQVVELLQLRRRYIGR